MKLYDGYVLIMVALLDTLVRDVVEFDGSIGIAQTAGLAGESISVDTVGVYEFTATNADLIAVGTPMYWDDTAKEATIVATDMTPMGVSWGTKAATTDGTIAVKIG